MFKKILIANRGEIAVRVTRTLQEMGVTAVAIHSDADRGAVHVRCADEAYGLEGVTSGETYLRGDKIVQIARIHGVDAIHPGYGFLSENADFAQMCADAGITFIGPSPSVIRAMGDKIVAKRTLAAAGVPVVPGWSGEGRIEMGALASEARAIGYPVLIKAAAGGGGKGMRVVEDERFLAAGVEAAQREANSAFGDARVFLEKYVARPRHVEFQIFGDTHGHVVHLFERECSIQRRHQKIVEESPSPALTRELRASMGEAAVRAAKAIGYTNAGTVEFLVDEKGSFYFLEVNTRLQVEHPVTEMITRQDLVRWQVRVAAGEPLPFSQDDIRSTGHALECRVYAEDPRKGFLPSVGTIARYVEPSGANIRVDSGVARGSEVAVYYDPMLAKLVVWGSNRPEAIERMLWSLRRYVVMGITTNIAFLQDLMNHPEFRAGRLDTHFLERCGIGRDVNGPPADALVAAAFDAGRPDRARRLGTADEPTRGEGGGPWRTAGHWRGV